MSGDDSTSGGSELVGHEGGRLIVRDRGAFAAARERRLAIHELAVRVGEVES